MSGSKKSKFSMLYIKYTVKTPIVFYVFLTAGIVLFLYMTLNLSLDVTQSFDAEVSEDKVTFDCGYEIVSNIIYLYTDRNEKIYKYNFTAIEVENGITVLLINNADALSGNYKADIVVGKQSLFERIFISGGKA